MMRSSFKKIEESQHAFCFHVENYCDRSTPHAAETDPLETMFQKPPKHYLKTWVFKNRIVDDVFIRSVMNDGLLFRTHENKKRKNKPRRK